jgi:transcriptional regulator with XRE-family HTH domain
MKIKREFIQELIKRKSLKQKDVAEMLGLSQQEFNNCLHRRIITDMTITRKLADILEVDISEILVPFDLNESSQPYFKKKDIDPKNFIPFHDINQQIDLFNLAAENGSYQPKDYVYLPGVSADLVFSYFGKGMSPQIENGDWLAIRRINDFSFFNYGSLYFVVTKELVIVRTLRKSSNEKTILLISSQDFNDPIELPISSIKALYAITAIIKRNIL